MRSASAVAPVLLALLSPSRRTPAPACHPPPGPNASGKSCYARGVALLVFLAHLGAWVPAEECRWEGAVGVAWGKHALAVGCVDLRPTLSHGQWPYTLNAFAPCNGIAIALQYAYGASVCTHWACRCGDGTVCASVPQGGAGGPYRCPQRQPGRRRGQRSEHLHGGPGAGGACGACGGSVLCR